MTAHTLPDAGEAGRGGDAGRMTEPDQIMQRFGDGLAASQNAEPSISRGALWDVQVRGLSGAKHAAGTVAVDVPAPSWLQLLQIRGAKCLSQVC